MALGTQIFLLAGLLVLSGFFSGAEVALLSLNKLKARQMFDQKRIGAVYIKKLKDEPQRMLSTILIGNNLVNVGASAIATSIAINMFQSFAMNCNRSNDPSYFDFWRNNPQINSSWEQ